MTSCRGPRNLPYNISINSKLGRPQRKVKVGVYVYFTMKYAFALDVHFLGKKSLISPERMFPKPIFHIMLKKKKYIENCVLHSCVSKGSLLKFKSPNYYPFPSKISVLSQDHSGGF